MLNNVLKQEAIIVAPLNTLIELLLAYLKISMQLKAGTAPRQNLIKLNNTEVEACNFNYNTGAQTIFLG